MQKQVLEIIEKTIKDNYDLEKNDLKLEIPPKKELWDFAFWWFQLAKDLKKSPDKIVEDLKNHLKNKNYDLFEDLETTWPYLNIKINKNFFTKSFLTSLENDDFLDLKEQNKDKTIVIDYIWANVGKPLHIGHMCTPNQGQTMINIYKKLWYNVISDSHIGDWGIIFGKLILAYKKWWDEQKLKQNAVEHLFELYIKITAETEKNPDLEEQTRQEFRLLSKWNPESIVLWKIFTTYSIEATNKQLTRLHIKSDFNIWESFYEWLNLPKIEDIPDLSCDMKYIVSELLKKQIAIQNEDNSVWVIFSEELKIPSCVLQKRDGAHGYLASDLAAIKYRVENYNPEKIIYFVDSRQQLHLKQAFTIADIAWWILKDKLIHAYNWFISLKDGAMSTRKWKIIKLDALLNEAEVRAKKIILEKRDDINEKELEELSKIIWIGAIKYGYLKKNREIDIIFDWDEFMSFEWNSGPYIQYAYVRAKRILEKANFSNIWSLKSSFTYNEEIELVKRIWDFKDILLETSSKNMPHILASYCYDLTKTFNSFYNNVSVLNEVDIDLLNLRLALVYSFSEVLKESFTLLSIEMPEKM